MKKAKSYVTLVFVFICINTYSQWQEQNSGVAVNLWDVCFVDSLDGWAIGDSSVVIRTTNGGNTWNSIRLNFPTNSDSKMRFVDTLNGFILSKGKLYSSSDGGNNWIQLDTIKSLGINDFCFMNESTGWITLSDSWFAPKITAIAKTNNKGKTWNVVYRDTIQYVLPFEAIDFLNGNFGLASRTSHQDNSETKFYRTENGGLSWEYVGNYRSSIYDLRIIDSSKIIAGGSGLVTSIDKGVNWVISNDFLYYLKDFSYANRENVWFIYVSPSGEYQIFYTNPTLTFTKIAVPPGIIANALDNFLTKYCWVVGNNGKVFLYKDGITKVETELERTKRFKISQNYPNPFNSETRIEVSINYYAKATITIYDILGRIVKVLSDDIWAPGVYSIRWDGLDAHNLKCSSGIYLFDFRANNYEEVKKIILLQ
ncbi:MAG: YCF48-related protein [Bacteroidetes bacterium]|nr:YCF48-related protein [Bacteroidota bacterium]